MRKIKFRDRVCSRLLLICVMLFSAVSLLPVAVAEKGGVTDERRWVDRAALLVERAATGRAEGKKFTKDVKAQRADLRELMRGSGADIPDVHRQMHMSMVLLGVLLKTSAGCQTGGRVVCPVGLLSQLRTVLKNTYINLNIYEGQHLAADPQGATQ